MDAITEIHTLLSRTIWMFFLALGLWGGFRAVRGQGVDGGYIGAMAIGQILFLVQFILGLLLYLSGSRVADTGIHILYGVFALVFLPFIYGSIRGDDSNRAQWVFCFCTLFLFGITLRAIETAG